MPPTPSSSEVPFDEKAALHNTGGDRQLLGTVVGMFLEQVAERFGRLEDALRRNDAVALERAAHSLKGTAATLALGRVRELAAGLEEMGANGDLSAVSGRLNELRAALDAAESALRALLASTG